MPRNVFFSQGVKSEQNLVEDLTIEALKIYGMEIYYLPRAMVSRDNILNEDIESKFSAAYMIEMYIENVDGFNGDGTLFSKFGLEIRDQATFVVSKRQWEKLVGLWNSGIISNRPAEGDLLYFPLTKSFFEIKFVDHKSPFYQLSKVPVYKLNVELFEYSNEAVATGIKDVDVLQEKFATEYYFDIENGNGTMFKVGEVVTQVLIPATMSMAAHEIYGKILKYSQETPASPLRLAIGEITTNTGAFAKFRATTGATDKITGATTGAIWDIVAVHDIDTTPDNLVFVGNNQQAQNQPIELAADAVIDFSEANPFGDPSSTL